MAVYLPLVFLFEKEHDLSRYNAFVWVLEVQIGVEAKGRGIFVQVGGGRARMETDLLADLLGILINSKKGQAVQDAWVDFFASVGHNTYNNLDVYEAELG